MPGWTPSWRSRPNLGATYHAAAYAPTVDGSPLTGRCRRSDRRTPLPANVVYRALAHRRQVMFDFVWVEAGVLAELHDVGVASDIQAVQIGADPLDLRGRANGCAIDEKRGFPVAVVRGGQLVGKASGEGQYDGQVLAPEPFAADTGWSEANMQLAFNPDVSWDDMAQFERVWIAGLELARAPLRIGRKPYLDRSRRSRLDEVDVLGLGEISPPKSQLVGGL